MSSTEEDETMMLLSSLLSSGICSIPPNQHGTWTSAFASFVLKPHTSAQWPDDVVFTTGEEKVKRRRKKSRSEGDETKKRRLSKEQVKFLEMSFVRERKLEFARKVDLATEAGLDPKQVAVWFQNRRARWKSKKLEEEYVKLKLDHQATIVEKCHLEAEVLKLKEQLLEAKMSIEKLSSTGGNGCYGDTGSSQSTSISVETTLCQPFLGGYEFLYINEHNYVNMLDWVDLYEL